MNGAGESKPKPTFEILEHPADVGFAAYGATQQELFENAAAAMFSLACEPSAIQENVRRELVAEGEDAEALLYAWLAEILAVADAEGLVFRRAEVQEISERRLRGVAYGEKFDRTRHHAGTYIKAVTFHQLEVRHSEQGWRARVFLDV